MNHLQNKSLPFQQINKNKHQYNNRNRYRFQENAPSIKVQDVDVFFSDQDNGNPAPKKKGELDDIFSGAREEIGKEKPKEEVRNKKGRFASKKKSGKNKPQSKPVQAVQLPAKEVSPMEIEAQTAPQIIEVQDNAITKPTAPTAFQTCDETYLNKLQSMKAKVDKKFTAQKGEKNIQQALQKTRDENCFRYLSQYRAYFQKETQMTYEMYYSTCESAKKMAVFSKINQLIRLEKQSKHQLLSKLEKEKFRFRKETNIIQSIAQESIGEAHLPSKKVVNAACNNNLNEQFRTINQFLSQNYSLIEPNKNNEMAQNISPQRQLLNDEQKKRREKPKSTEPSHQFKQHYAQYPITQTNKNLQLQLNKMNDRKKILADIQIVNKKCEEKEKYERLQAERLERQREKEKSKMSKKEPTPSNASSTQAQKYDGIEDDESEKKRQEMIREAQWSTYSAKSNPKIKRLEILNRYHYNPFEENQGEDQCELWKKLMSIEIKNLKNDNISIKNEEFNHVLIDELMKEVENGKESDKYNRTPANDIFILQTNYKPHQNSQRSREGEESMREAREKKTKMVKKHKKNSKHKKNKEEIDQAISSRQENIEDFFDFGEGSVKKDEEEEIFGYAPFCIKSNPKTQTREQVDIKVQPLSHQGMLAQNNSISFSYDQLPLQIQQEIKQQPSQKPSDNQQNYKYLLDPEYFDNMDNYHFR